MMLEVNYYKILQWMIKIINVYKLKEIKWKLLFKKYRNFYEYNIFFYIFNKL